MEAGTSSALIMIDAWSAGDQQVPRVLLHPLDDDSIAAMHDLASELGLVPYPRAVSVPPDTTLASLTLDDDEAWIRIRYSCGTIGRPIPRKLARLVALHHHLELIVGDMGLTMTHFEDARLVAYLRDPDVTIHRGYVRVIS